jgi:hypothetical protein
VVSSKDTQNKVEYRVRDAAGSSSILRVCGCGAGEGEFALNQAGWRGKPSKHTKPYGNSNLNAHIHYYSENTH